MPELPRLDQFAPIAVTPRPTPNPQVAGMVSGTVAQGAGQMEQILGHITAKDIELQKHERAVQERLDAENAVHNHLEAMTNEQEAVRSRQKTYEEYRDIKFNDANGKLKVGPIQTDDLMAVYDHIQKAHLHVGMEELPGNFGKYAFANEFNQRSLSIRQQLHTDRDNQKRGDLQSAFSESMRHDLVDVGSGQVDVNDAIATFRQRAKTNGFIYPPHELNTIRNKHEKDLRMEPYRNMPPTTVLKMLSENQVKGLTGEERLDLEKEVHEANWRNMSELQTKNEMAKRDFNNGSEKLLKERFPMVTRGLYTYQHLENDFQSLTKEDHSTLFSMLEVQAKGGGKGNDLYHAHGKYKIAGNPEAWDVDRVKGYVSVHGLNDIEGVDLLNELSKAKSQERNRENDPNHYSKNYTYKKNYDEMDMRLGGAPFSVLKPQDQAVIAHAMQEYRDIFQRAYDEKKPLPNFNDEYERIIDLYKPRMTWEISDPFPYKSLPDIKSAFEKKELTKTQAIELGKLMQDKERMKRLQENAKEKAVK